MGIIENEYIFSDDVQKIDQISVHSFICNSFLDYRNEVVL